MRRRDKTCTETTLGRCSKHLPHNIQRHHSSRGVRRSFRLSQLPFRVRLAYCLPPDAILRARGVDRAPADCGETGPVYDALAEMKSWDDSERTWISSIHAKNVERDA